MRPSLSRTACVFSQRRSHGAPGRATSLARANGRRHDRLESHDHLARVAAIEENDKGSIEVGKLADFVLLSEDPTAIDPEKLAGIKIEGP